MADDAAIGTIVWGNPDNAKTSDNNYAIADHGAPADISHYLKATNFGFAIPAGATIDGILVEIEMITGIGANSCRENAIKIVKADGTIGATNKSTGAPLPSIEQYVSYGGAADLWGEIWNDTDINDSDFGVVLATETVEDKNGNANVDHIRITVYYTAGWSGKISGVTNPAKVMGVDKVNIAKVKGIA